MSGERDSQPTDENLLSPERIAEIKRRITLTVQWYFDPRGARYRVRSVYAVPRAHLVDLRRDELACKTIVDQIMGKRRNKLDQSGLLSDDAVAYIRSRFEHGRLADGKLAIFEPGVSLEDGAAQTSSFGFFDGNNEPGWDTWIDFIIGDPVDETIVESYLVFWVPPDQIENVNHGIDANPENCIRWLADVDTPITRQLLEAVEEWDKKPG